LAFDNGAQPMVYGAFRNAVFLGRLSDRDTFFFDPPNNVCPNFRYGSFCSKNLILFFAAKEKLLGKR